MNQQIYNVQILRFIAAALVLFSHVQHEAVKVGFLDKSNYSPWDFAYFAGGVDIFFVISGFIMYRIASSDFGKPGASKVFLLRRLIRIAPPYWLFTAAMILAAMVFKDHVTHSALSLEHILYSFAFIPSENPYGKVYPVLMLGWTLNFEAMFYLIFGCGLSLKRRPGLILVFAVLCCLGLLGMASLGLSTPFSFWFHPIVLEFLLGILLGIAHEKNIRWSPTVGWSLAALGVVSAVVLKQIGVAEHYWAARPLWMGLPALAICAGATLMADTPGQSGRAKNVFVFLGDASYALYLSHPFALNAAILGWAALGFTDPWAYVVVACAFSIMVGVAVYVVLEKPMTKYLNRALAGWLDTGRQCRLSAAS